MLRLFCCLLLCSGAVARTLPTNAPSNSDEILSWPGWDAPMPSRMYSGYLNITDTKHVHYVFVESESNPSKDPIVIWLNGGPGCSSLGGFFYENGPFIIDPTDYSKLTLRPVRWSQIANVLFIEAPVGVGFSFSDNPDVDYQCTDDTTAQDNLKTLEMFYELYPQYTTHELYITGESYAGIYIPTLAEAILEATDKGTYAGGPLKGIAVGNGCTGSEVGICGWSDQGTYYEYKFLLSTAFISDAQKQEINTVCDWDAAKAGKSLSKQCELQLDVAAKQIGHINTYDVYGDCVDGLSDSRLKHHPRAPHNSFLTKSKSSLTGPDACIDGRAASSYLNSDAVVKALHVERPVAWAVCGTVESWNYTSTRPNLPRDTYPSLVQRIKVLIYNGDWDACVPYTDNEAWTVNMGYKPSVDWHPWTYTTAEGVDSQVGGYAVKYTIPNAQPNSWFQYITVRGGGHQVPETAADKALSMLNRMIHDLPF